MLVSNYKSKPSLQCYGVFCYFIACYKITYLSEKELARIGLVGQACAVLAWF